MKKNLRIALRPLSLLWLLIAATFPAQAAEPGFQPVSLAGEWRFALDRAGIGQEQRWFAQNLSDRIRLPGALQSQGYGDPIGTATPWALLAYDRFWYLREDYKAYAEPERTKVPFLSQPTRHYLGAAWYQREIDIPASW